MADLPQVDQWDAGIYQLETTDAVLGGVNGPDNIQAKQLANRTLYLKNLIENINTAQAVADHVAATDPHNQYLTTPEGDGRYLQSVPDAAAIAAQAITAHKAATDPHNQYLTTPEGDTRYLQSVPTASTTAKGIVELATQAEALTGTDAARAITASRLAYVFNQKFANSSLASTGYMKFPGGLMIQWGSASVVANASITVTFPVAFPSAFFVGFSSANYSSDIAELIHVHAASKPRMSIRSGSYTGSVYWLVLGY
ncbi:MAG: hypothetical protein ABW168_00395 [Sedimenticola sp.]